MAWHKLTQSKHDDKPESSVTVLYWQIHTLVVCIFNQLKMPRIDPFLAQYTRMEAK